MNVQWSPGQFVGGKQVEPLVQNRTSEKTPAQVQSNFADTLKGAIDNLNNIQQESDKLTEGLASGQVEDLHQVMITAQKASITLETTVQVQQKVIDAYNEVMRMQI